METEKLFLATEDTCRSDTCEQDPANNSGRFRHRGLIRRGHIIAKRNVVESNQPVGTVITPISDVVENGRMSQSAKPRSCSQFKGLPVIRPGLICWNINKGKQVTGAVRARINSNGGFLIRIGIPNRERGRLKPACNVHYDRRVVESDHDRAGIGRRIAGLTEATSTEIIINESSRIIRKYSQWTVYRIDRIQVTNRFKVDHMGRRESVSAEGGCRQNSGDRKFSN